MQSQTEKNQALIAMSGLALRHCSNHAYHPARMPGSLAR